MQTPNLNKRIQQIRIIQIKAGISDGPICKGADVGSVDKFCNDVDGVFVEGDGKGLLVCSTDGGTVFCGIVVGDKEGLALVITGDSESGTNVGVKDVVLGAEVGFEVEQLCG